MTSIQFLVLNLNFKTQKEIYFLMGHLIDAKDARARINNLTRVDIIEFLFID